MCSCLCVCECVYVCHPHSLITSSLTCTVVRARGIHGGFCRVIDDAPHPAAVLLMVDDPLARVDVPETHTTLVVAGGKLVLVIRIEEHGATCSERKMMHKLEGN